MADNVTTQSSTLATVPSGTKVATREVTYSGDASSHIAPTGLVTFSGTDDAKTATDVPAGGGVEATALRVTIASDSTGVISVDDNGGSLTVDGTVGVSGTVTVATHDVGSITTAVTPGTAAANLGKAEDAAHASGDVGVMALAVRQASPANLSGAAGDYEPLQVNGGRLWASATIDAALPAGTNNIGDVDVLSVPAPLSTTGGGTEATALRVTIASDSTGVVSVDDNGSSLTVDGTVSVSGAVDTELPTAAALADNAANPTAPAVGAFGMVWDGTTWDRQPGTAADGALVNLGANNDVTVTGTVTANLAAGTNNIGDVDVLSVVPGTGATSLGKAVDSAAGGTDTGVAALAVRDDALTTLTPVDGDYVPLRTNSTGALWVRVENAASGGTSSTDEATYTPTSSTGTPIMGAADETTPDAAAEGTLAIIRSTLNRALHVNLRDASGAEVAVGGGTQYTEDAAAAADPVGTALMLVRQDTLSGTTVSADGDNVAARAASTGAQYVEVTAGTTKLGSATDGLLVNLGANNDVTVTGTVTANLAAGTNNIGDVDVLSVPAPLSTTGGGTEATALRVTIANDSTGVVSVDDNGASLTVDGTVTASNTTGNVAHDSADSGSPVKIGAKAKATLEAVTAVAADDRTDLYADLNGALITRPMAPHGDLLVERVSDTGGTSTAFTTFGAPGAGVRNYITTIVVHNANTTTSGFVDIRDGAAGSVLFTVPAPANGGAVISLPVPLRQPTANTALAYDVSAAISTVYISLVGYQSNV